MYQSLYWSYFIILWLILFAFIWFYLYLTYLILSPLFPIYLPTYLSIYLSIHPSIHPSSYLPIQLSTYLSIYMYIYIYSYIRPSVHLSTFPSIHWSIDLSMYLFNSSTHFSICVHNITYTRYIEIYFHKKQVYLLTHRILHDPFELWSRTQWYIGYGNGRHRPPVWEHCGWRWWNFWLASGWLTWFEWAELVENWGQNQSFLQNPELKPVDPSQQFQVLPPLSRVESDTSELMIEMLEWGIWVSWAMRWNGCWRCAAPPTPAHPFLLSPACCHQGQPCQQPNAQDLAQHQHTQGTLIDTSYPEESGGVEAGSVAMSGILEVHLLAISMVLAGQDATFT